MDPDTPAVTKPPVFNYILSFLLVGIAWGFTTPFIRRAAVNYHQPTDASIHDPNRSWLSRKTRLGFFTVLGLLRSPSYAIPLLVNLTGSVWFFILVGQAGKIITYIFICFSIAVPQMRQQWKESRSFQHNVILVLPPLVSSSRVIISHDLYRCSSQRLYTAYWSPAVSQNFHSQFQSPIHSLFCLLCWGNGMPKERRYLETLGSGWPSCSPGSVSALVPSLEHIIPRALATPGVGHRGLLL